MSSFVLIAYFPNNFFQHYALFVHFQFFFPTFEFDCLLQHKTRREFIHWKCLTSIFPESVELFMRITSVSCVLKLILGVHFIDFINSLLNIFLHIFVFVFHRLQIFFFSIIFFVWFLRAFAENSLAFQKCVFVKRALTEAAALTHSQTHTQTHTHSRTLK